MTAWQVYDRQPLQAKKSRMKSASFWPSSYSSPHFFSQLRIFGCICKGSLEPVPCLMECRSSTLLFYPRSFSLENSFTWAATLEQTTFWNKCFLLQTLREIREICTLCGDRVCSRNTLPSPPGRLLQAGGTRGTAFLGKRLGMALQRVQTQAGDFIPAARWATTPVFIAGLKGSATHIRLPEPTAGDSIILHGFEIE